MKMFWNYIVVMTAQRSESTTKSLTCTIKWLILCYVNFILKKRKNPPGRPTRPKSVCLCWCRGQQKAGFGAQTPPPNSLSSRLIYACPATSLRAPTPTGRVLRIPGSVHKALGRPLGTRSTGSAPELQVGTLSILHSCLQLDKVLRSLYV